MTIDTVMRSGVESEYHDSDWVFDAVQKLYAPHRYWPELAADFTSKPRSFEKSRENFNKKPRGDTYRSKAIHAMRLDANDAKRYGQARSARGPIDRVRSFFMGDR